MQINEFINHFAAQFEGTLVFTPETRFREIEEWSSLTALSVLAMIDEEYDVQLRADEMRKTNNIQELYNLVNSHMNYHC